MPGPDVEVMARAPAQPAPIAMPTAANSSSACTTAIRRSPVFESTRNRSEYAIRFSQRDEEGVIGYHADIDHVRQLLAQGVVLDLGLGELGERDRVVSDVRASVGGGEDLLVHDHPAWAHRLQVLVPGGDV